MTEALWSLDAIETARRIAERDVSAAEVVESHLERLDAVNPALNAVTRPLHDAAREQARDADARQGRGEGLGALHGVPVTIKDNVDIAGQSSPNGLAALDGILAGANSPVVDNLLAAGAIVIGRTNTPEFSLRWHTDNPLFGATVNPWNASLTPGGSSGGASSSLAAGIGCIAHGNDLGGSLRYPAYCTGLTTIRPTQGRIPAFNPTATGERPPALLRMSTQGPITRSVADAGRALEVMAGHDPRDPFWVPARREQPDPESPVPVALVRTPPGTPVSPGVARALDRAARMLEASGDYRVEEVEPPELGLCAEVWTGLITAETRTMMGETIREMGSPDIIASLEHFESYHPAVDLAGYMGLLAERTRLLRAWTGFLQQHRLIVGPVSTIPPFAPNEDVGPRPGAERIFRSQSLLVTVNLLGLPSVAVCTGLDEGLPLGVQVIGARFGDELCLGAAATIEAAAGRVTPIDPR
ncbi:MAG: amidase [Alphaproteobacteria bacterium]|nr:amidase [Alphaproteobacteria bacterium]